MNKIKLSKKFLKQSEDTIMHGTFFLCGLLVVLVLCGIFVVLFYSAFPMLKEVRISEFLLTTIWNPNAWGIPKYGILSMLVSTILVSIGAMFIAVPLGIGTAAYLTDVARPRVREIAKPIIEVLASIPSVVIGFLGIIIIGPFLAKVFHQDNGLNALNGMILLAIMALPTIISISEDALHSVPKAYEEVSLALGATHWQTVIKVKIPAAMSGIIAACVLGMGRVIGETMTVLMATGCAPVMPQSLFDPVRTITSTIAIELGEVAYNTTHYYALFAIGFVLFFITFLINLIADVVLHKYQGAHK